MPFPIYVPILIFMAFMLVMMVGKIVIARAREKAFAQAAADLGMQFDPRPDGVSGARFQLMDKGRRKKMRNHLGGKIEDIEAEIFDYQYTTGGGRDTHTHRQSVVLMRVGGHRVPRFELKPEGFFQRIGAAMGMQDIDFEEDDEFSKRFVLKSDEEASMRLLFNDVLRSTMCAMESKLCVEAEGDAVIVYRRSRRMKPEDVSRRLTEAFDIATVLWVRSREVFGVAEDAASAEDESEAI